ncbi:NAD-dependent epimerase/dehydratase family protein [Corallococcus praedator]|uniref:NAD-dependent epimerase/dehydratase family protein n=1 Tax=Corallococcus praedator TaxID=2316724 RepID=A0ABX9QMD1_9BACT|nr:MULTISPECIES: NAD-dependent epimerase/dehydratase family protein [Corallococcus]RKH32804.1 NAD-dependent epimerase/dehydratase family protein [Corallococcus sp. CA031C]RKI13461.1 NAD-dependent epimerase/dehydratase family protein [Corallococcus praedator]
MRAFVTGGSGFVGKHLLAALAKRGEPARALARSPASVAAVQAAGGEPWEGDLSDPERLRLGMEGCDTVFHSAAHVKMSGPRAEFYDVNVRGTEAVLEAARAAGVKRLVHVSTEAVLVDGGPMVRLNETHKLPQRPVGPYPSTKGEAERRVLSVNSPDFTTVAVRPRLVWGPGDTTVLPALVAAVKAGRFRWIGGGRYLTSTCHVANAVEGLLLAAEKGRGGQAYFVTDGPPVEFRAFVTALLKTQGVDPGDKSLPTALAAMVAVTSDLVWDVLGLKSTPPLSRTELLLAGQEVTVSDEKARQELGYTGSVSREEGLRSLAAQAG